MYTFTKETAATFKLKAGESEDTKALTLKGVNANVASADSIVAGVQGLLYIANKHEDYNYAQGIRVVNEDVDYDN